jgi:hypothetical protein
MEMAEDNRHSMARFDREQAADGGKGKREIGRR